MDTLIERIQEKWVMATLALILGLVIGLVYAWGLNPVEWTDATPDRLREDLRVEYLRMAIDSYSINRDVDAAIDRYEQLGEYAEDTLQLVAASPGEVDPTAIQNFSAVVEIMEEPGQAEPVEGEETEASEPATDATTPVVEERPAGSSAMRLILPVCGATLVLGLLLIGALYLRNRLGEEEEEPFLEPGFDMEEDFEGRLEPGFDEEFDDDFADDFSEEEPAYMEETKAVESSGEPLATFRTIYSLGDDRYDDSFSIESAAGDFLGECGVGIGEIMGAGDPKKVSAFEVWLFDKNDIQTVTKVMLSNYAFKDDETRNRMAAKGDPVLAEPGGTVYLETASLEVEARIVDMKYGSSALPNESFFERMTIELRAMPK
jgi:hypothetical protein